MGQCALDDITPEAAEHLAREALQRYGLARLAKDLGGPGAGRVLGSPASCDAVRINQAVSAVHIAVLLIGIALTLKIMVSGGRGDWRTWGWLEAMSTVGLILTALRLRHALSLAIKLAWMGTDSVTQLMVLLAAGSVAVGYIVSSSRDWVPDRALPALLGLSVLAACGKIAVMARGLSNPGGAYFTAVTSAADRVVSRDAISRLKASLAT